MCVIPSHILLDQGLENPTARTSRLQLAKSEEEKKTETIRDPAEGRDAKEHNTIFGNIAEKLVAVDLPSTVICIRMEYEAVHDREKRESYSGDEGGYQAGDKQGYMLSRGEAEEGFPAAILRIVVVFISTGSSLVASFSVGCCCHSCPSIERLTGSKGKRDEKAVKDLTRTET